MHLAIVLYFPGELSGELKQYYIDVEFTNNASGHASIIYEEYGKPRERVVYTNTTYRMTAIVKTSVKPVFALTAKEYGKQNVYYLNGQTSYTVEPSEHEGDTNIVYITDAGKNFSYL